MRSFQILMVALLKQVAQGAAARNGELSCDVRRVMMRCMPYISMHKDRRAFSSVQIPLDSVRAVESSISRPSYG